MASIRRVVVVSVRGAGAGVGVTIGAVFSCASRSRGLRALRLWPWVPAFAGTQKEASVMVFGGAGDVFEGFGEAVGEVVVGGLRIGAAGPGGGLAEGEPAEAGTGLGVLVAGDGDGERLLRAERQEDARLGIIIADGAAVEREGDAGVGIVAAGLARLGHGGVARAPAGARRLADADQHGDLRVGGADLPRQAGAVGVIGGVAARAAGAGHAAGRSRGYGAVEARRARARAAAPVSPAAVGQRRTGRRVTVARRSLPDIDHAVLQRLAARVRGAQHVAERHLLAVGRDDDREPRQR